MKHLILIAALLTGSAWAQTIATSPNNAGGEIRLMGGKGSCPSGMLVVLSTSHSGKFAQGCWFLMEDQVVVHYDGGEKRIYSIDGFTIINREKTKGQSL